MSPGGSPGHLPSVTARRSLVGTAAPCPAWRPRRLRWALTHREWRPAADDRRGCRDDWEEHVEAADRQPGRDRDPHRARRGRARHRRRSPCYSTDDAGRCTSVEPTRPSRCAEPAPRPTSTSSSSSPRPATTAATPSTRATASWRRTPRFARRCAEAGLTFVGPSPEALELFGDKVRARALAVRAGRAGRAAGSPSRSTWRWPRRSWPRCRPGAAMIVKAVAGGGGRGMRVVRDRDEVAEAVRARPLGGGGGVRQRRRLRRAARRARPPHRGADRRRRHAGRCSASGARLQHPAPPPEAGRDRARRRRSTTRCAPRSPTPPCAWPRAAGYRSLGHVRVPRRDRRRRRRAVRVHRGQPAAAGRAHRHRGGHRRRPRAAAAASSPGRDAGRPRLHPGDRCRRRAAWRSRRGSTWRRCGPDGGDAARRAACSPRSSCRRARAARRHVRLRRLPHQPALRLAAGQGRDVDDQSDLAGRGQAEPRRRSASSASRVRRRTSPSSRPCWRTRRSSPAADTRFVDEHIAELLDAAPADPRPVPPVRRRGARDEPACGSTRPTRWPCSTAASRSRRRRRAAPGRPMPTGPPARSAVRAPMQGTIVSVQVARRRRGRRRAAGAGDGGDEDGARRSARRRAGGVAELTVAARRHRATRVMRSCSSRRPTWSTAAPAATTTIDLDEIRPDLAEVLERHAVTLDEARPDAVAAPPHRPAHGAREHRRPVRPGHLRRVRPARPDAGHRAAARRS